MESIRGTVEEYDVEYVDVWLEAERKRSLKPEKILNPAVKVIKEAADGYAYQTLNGLFVIQSAAVENDGNVWIHTSFSRKSRMPTYSDMAMVKRLFVGEDSKAIMIFPDKAHHVNLHEFCLHFFTPVYHEPLPEFSLGGTL